MGVIPTATSWHVSPHTLGVVLLGAGAPTYTENLYLKVRELRVSRRGRGSLLWLSKWEDAVERRRCSEARKT